MPAAAAAAPDVTAPDEVMARGYARGRARDEAVRAQLEPLAPGERPTAVTIAALLALAIAVADPLLWVLGATGEDAEYSTRRLILLEAVMLTAAWGLWHARYWAVLGFQMILLIAIVLAAFALPFASNLRAVLLCVGTLAVAGPLFWKLIRAMARIQMPSR